MKNKKNKLSFLSFTHTQKKRKTNSVLIVYLNEYFCNSPNFCSPNRGFSVKIRHFIRRSEVASIITKFNSLWMSDPFIIQTEIRKLQHKKKSNEEEIKTKCYLHYS